MNIEQPQFEEKSEKEQVLDKIKMVRQEVGIKGFNDSELPELNKLISQVEADEIEPQKALERAHEIKDSKQDYH